MEAHLAAASSGSGVGREPGGSGIAAGEGSPEFSPRRNVQQRTYADFLLGLSVRRHMAGYALLRFEDLLPLQFGLVDVRKALEVQQKALEIGAVLRELRNAAPEKLRQALQEDIGGAGSLEDDDAEEDELAGLPSRTPSQSSKKPGRWIVSIDDSTVDRAKPVTHADNVAQQAIAMLQGLVIGDCKRLFKVAPVLVHPRKARLLVGVRGRGEEARKEVFEVARVKVSDFPAIVNERSGSLKDDTFLMSDAWASARHAQRAAMVAELRSDARLVEELRREVLASKPLKRLEEAAAELYPRKAGRELAEVMAIRAERLIDERLHRLIDEEEARHGGAGAGGSCTGSSRGHGRGGIGTKGSSRRPGGAS